VDVRVVDHLVGLDHVVGRDLADEPDAREPLHQRRLVQRDFVVDDGARAIRSHTPAVDLKVGARGGGVGPPPAPHPETD